LLALGETLTFFSSLGSTLTQLVVLGAR